MPADERVRAAIENWAPRFVANGVDPNDFQRVTGSLESWNDWFGQWFACGAMHERMAEEAEAAGRYESAAEHYLHASMAYHFGKYVFVQQPDALQKGHERVVATYQKALPYMDPPGERVAIPYENGDTMYGILRKPWHTPRPPVVIIIPGLDSVKEEMHGYGNDLLKRGIAVLAIDGPGQGELESRYPLRHDYEVPVGYAIDYLEHRPDVDASRLGIIGVSLGGHYAPRIAALEPRVKAAIAISGAYSLASHFDTHPILTREAFIYRLKVSSASEARKKLETFDLTGLMEYVQSPLLIIAGARDRLFPVEDAERTLREAGDKGTLWLFEDGNHVCNNIPYKYRPQQADWMREQLQAASKQRQV
jgi:2,6-dihydroxypseudooxynicotine hydrolase